jgi:16S rRNA (guanine1207-N2)-methyltransferase
MHITLGEGGERAREEDFLDGAFRVTSRDGLHPNQRAMLSLLPRGKAGRALVINSDYAVLALAMRALNPDMEVIAHFDDAWAADIATDTLAKHPDSTIQVVLAPDPPAGPWNYILMPLERRGVADLVRERIRMAASTHLAPQGLLIASSDTKDDRFIRDEVKKAFGALHIAPEDKRRGAVGYVARKPAKQLVAPPHSWTTFTAREKDRTLTFHSRLGVFCHDRVDPGTHALLATMDVAGAQHVLDLGCGSGVVGIVTMLREPDARVTFVDSNARAIQATKRNLEEHRLTPFADHILLTANPPRDIPADERYDLVVTNPPYYGNWRIAELFLQTARAALAPGGKLIVVTKSPEYYREQLAPDYEKPQEASKGGYAILAARRKK